MKREFSNFDVFAIVRELDDTLSKGTISNIYQVEDLLIIKINAIDGNKNLIIKRDLRINLTRYDYPIPKYPSQYVRNLRKYLRGRRILKVKQYKLDRIIIFELSSYESTPWKFIIELFSRGNYILVDENNITKIAKSYLKLKKRKILANKEYNFPESYGQNFLEINKQELSDLIQSYQEKEIVRTIARYINIAGTYAEEICKRADIRKEKSGSELDEKEISALYKELRNLRNQLMFSNINAHIVYDNEGNQTSVLPFELRIYKDYKKKYFPSFNEAVDEYYSKIDSEKVMERQSNNFEERINQQKKILKNQKEHVEKLKKEGEKYYEYGDFIYANFKSLEKLLAVINNAKLKGYSWNEINERLKQAKEKNMRGTKYFDRIIPTTQEIVININGDEVYLDSSKSIGENASMIYSRGKKSKQKIKGAKEAIKKTKIKIEKLHKEKETVDERIDFLVKKPEKQWYERYRWFKSSDGHLVVGGRDASSNEAIFRKYIESNDMVLHTDFPGSPLVVIKNPEDRTIPDQTLNQAAVFVASYSQAWKENWGVADVFYVKPNQVSKNPPSGEFLPKGSFMIEGKKSFIRNAKTELSIGLKFIKMKSNAEEYDHILYPKVIGGPIKPIREQTKLNIMISPSSSGLTKGKLAKKIKNKFLKNSNKEQNKWIELLSLDDLILVLPNGFSKIYEKSNH
ncbi:MAG: fibronectin-binding domain-containing protein [Promethearchaeota archaeon]|nr:MAG: fibronectin-binding domain-containing protein [Candidatus Lokiarchaeota archaeon]